MKAFFVIFLLACTLPAHATELCRIVAFDAAGRIISAGEYIFTPEEAQEITKALQVRTFINEPFSISPIDQALFMGIRYHKYECLPVT